MARRYDDDDEHRPGGFWRFLKGVIVALALSAVAVVVLSNYVLPPPVIPEPEPGPGEVRIVDGIEVSNAPAYSGGAGTDAGAGAEAGSADPATTVAAAADAMDGPAMVVNSAPFESDPGTPLVAVVLDDTGAQPLLHGLLFSMNMPVTIGVVAGAAGDLETAEAARKAGLEVVAQLAIRPPGGSDGAELEYALPAADAALRTLTLVQRMSMAVAVSRTLDSPSPPDAPVLRGIANVIGPMGYAYLDVGVGADEESPAVASGQAAAEGALVEISRHTIPATATAAEAHAILDEAAADAAIRGSAVVLAEPGEAVVQALLLWGGEGDGAVARLAPLTAVIRRQIGAQ